MNIRKYTESDRDAVLGLFHLNSPLYFASSEILDLHHYLDHDAADYYVIEDNLQIIGSGGFNFVEDGLICRISWDMIHPMHQGKGLGSLITKFRINEIRTLDTKCKIIVRTSQYAYLFYQNMGFRLAESTKDYWALGFDLYLMEYNKKDTDK